MGSTRCLIVGSDDPTRRDAEPFTRDARDFEPPTDSGGFALVGVVRPRNVRQYDHS